MSSNIKVIKKKQFDECIFVFKTSFNNQNFIKDIFSSSKEGNLNLILRPISYRIFLDIFGNSITSWVDVISSQREEYKNKIKKFCKLKKISGDPLAGGNIKNDEDKDLKDLINKDLIRTYQDIDIFLKSNIKNYLANILYIWSKENKQISYRQGMNEILAVLLLAFYPVYFISKSKPKPNKTEVMKIINRFMNSEEINENDYEDLYVFFHDEEEIQSDLFYTFDAIMKRGLQLLYDPNPLDKKDLNYKLYELFPNLNKIKIDEDVPTYINKRCAYLIYEKLQGIDEELYEHFIKIDLPCTVFLHKWLRCLFNREFEYFDVLILWDSIFAHEYQDKQNEKYSLIFVDYVALAMLIKIRDLLKDKDQNDCLSILFKYPKNFEMSELLKLSEKVNSAMEERLNGKNSNIYDILGIMRPLQSRPIEIYERPVKKKEDVRKNNNNNNLNNNNNNNLNSNNNNDNNSTISKSTANTNTNNVVRYRKRSDNSNNTNTEESKGIMGTLSKIGGIVKDIGMKVTDKVSEKFEQLTSNDDYDSSGNQYQYNQYGNDMTQMNNNYYYSNEGYYENSIDIEPKRGNTSMSVTGNGNVNNSSMMTGYDKNDMMDIINKLEELDGRYSLYMSPKDKKDFKTIINYLKNNLN